MRPIASRARCFTNAFRALRWAHLVWKRGWRDCWVSDGNSGIKSTRRDTHGADQHTVSIGTRNLFSHQVKNCPDRRSELAEPSRSHHESFTPDRPVLCACRSTRADRQRRVPIRAEEDRALGSRGQ
eukprot:IDg1924t1